MTKEVIVTKEHQALVQQFWFRWACYCRKIIVSFRLDSSARDERRVNCRRRCRHLLSFVVCRVSSLCSLQVGSLWPVLYRGESPAATLQRMSWF